RTKTRILTELNKIDDRSVIPIVPYRGIKPVTGLRIAFNEYFVVRFGVSHTGRSARAIPLILFIPVCRSIGPNIDQPLEIGQFLSVIHVLFFPYCPPTAGSNANPEERPGQELQDPKQRRRFWARAGNLRACPLGKFDPAANGRR